MSEDRSLVASEGNSALGFCRVPTTIIDGAGCENYDVYFKEIMEGFTRLVIELELARFNVNEFKLDMPQTQAMPDGQTGLRAYGGFDMRVPDVWFCAYVYTPHRSVYGNGGQILMQPPSSLYSIKNFYANGKTHQTDIMNCNGFVTHSPSNPRAWVSKGYNAVEWMTAMCENLHRMPSPEQLTGFTGFTLKRNPPANAQAEQGPTQRSGQIQGIDSNLKLIIG